MRILVVGNYEPDSQESMQRYAVWLRHALERRGHRVTVVKPAPFFSLLARDQSHIKYLGYLDKFLLFPPRLRRIAKAHDLVHVADHSNSMYLRVVGGAPSLITCHDALAIRAARGEFPKSQTSWSGRLLQKWILSGLRSARNVLCVSAKTSKDLKVLTGETGARVRVIHQSLNWSYRPNAKLPSSLLSRLNLSPGQAYLLHVGGNQWYKNRTGALRIFAQLRATVEFSTTAFVLVGKSWTGEMRSLVRDLKLAEVIEAVGITNEELLALYCNALALLFPSLEEGFGWPILEAQACGCPVITTGRLPMSEVAGDAAIFIDPLDPPAAAKAIANGLVGRERLRMAGFSNIGRFDEDKIVDEYCAFYEAILGESTVVP